MINKNNFKDIHQLNLNDRQIKRIKLLAKIVGSVKTNHRVDTVKEVNKLRGKR